MRMPQLRTSHSLFGPLPGFRTGGVRRLCVARISSNRDDSAQNAATPRHCVCRAFSLSDQTAIHGPRELWVRMQLSGRKSQSVRSCP